MHDSETNFIASRLSDDYIEKLHLGHQRYQYVKALSSAEFTAVWLRCLLEDIKFDDLIDSLIEGSVTLENLN